MSISAGQHGRARRRTPFTHLARLSIIASMALIVAAAALAGAAHAQTPVAAYSFDEGSGATVSDAAGSHDGTIEGATWVSAGKYGSALEFDGVDDLVTVPDATELDLTGSFTLEAWVKPDTATAGPTISKAENVEGISGYALSARFFGKPAAHATDSGTIKALSGPDALPVEAWSHIAATSDGTTLRLYVAGELVASASGIPVKATATSLAIGHSQILNSWFDGQIDEVRLYDAKLSQIEIQVDRDNRVLAPPATDVLTTQADTGSFSELVSSIPISSEGAETVIYSLPLPALKAGEILRALGTVEVTNTHGYSITDSVRLVLGATDTEPTGTTITPWTSVKHTPEMYHWTLPFNGVYRMPSEPAGMQYLKLILKATSPSAETDDTLIVQPNFGRLAATRYTPVTNVLAQPTHTAQALWEPLPEQVTSVPVNSTWQRILTRDVSDLSADDVVDLVGQVELQNTSGTTVTLESKITMTETPCACGSTAAPVSTLRVSPGMTPNRIVHGTQFRITNSNKRYFNLLVRVAPESEAPQPVTVTEGSATLALVRHEQKLGTLGAALGEGTLQDTYGDAYPNVSSIPFAPPGGSQKRVAASAPLYGGIWKEEVIHARGLVTGDLNGGETAQILTQLILADSPTDVTGETVASLSGDKVPTYAQVDTLVKEGTYVVPNADPNRKYLNFVVYVSRNPAYEGESMSVPAASVSFIRAKQTEPLDQGFEDGLNAVFQYEWDGTATASTAVAREGVKSAHIDIDFSNSYEEDAEGVRRVELRPPDLRASGGYEGEDSWYGFSVYFPSTFKVTHPDDPEATAGRHNTFTQFRSTGAGLNCPSLIGPPVGFTTRYWKENGHTNPGASETATPVDGEYIELAFNGGEITEDCSDTVNSGEQFVLAPVERGRWYDFVIHTRWTTEKGSPGTSTSEVWMDGDQVVGDETTAVATPSLYWYGSPGINSSDGYPQFGLYRGETEEDPPSDLYIDAVRSGDSYAEVEPGQ